jgi:hypothetical protein
MQIKRLESVTKKEKACGKVPVCVHVSRPENLTRIHRVALQYNKSSIKTGQGLLINSEKSLAINDDLLVIEGK